VVSVLVLPLTFVGLPTAWAKPEVGLEVTLEAARQAHEARRVLLVDIRKPEEHARGVAAGAKLLPMSQLGRRVGELPKGDTPIYLICNTQNRSAKTLEWMHKLGYTNVHFVRGGMSEWVQCGWPVVAP
jgi:rhodanese-related sulfurtransferase